MTSPSRLTIRCARRGDSAALARLHIASWRAAYRGLLPQRYLDELSHTAWERTWSNRLASSEIHVIVAEEADIIGFVSFGASRDRDAAPRTGEIYSIYLQPGQWRKGIGTQLHAEAVELLTGSEFVEATLWVLSTNISAREFYHRRGWSHDGCTKTNSRGGTEIIQVRYRKRLADAHEKKPLASGST
ncbi:GNAT family N-acetyltransferase [Actinomadura physcomitrii]|uniref:GNAT family N-acetyltransferase n=1 Tax=Actinomadura physcomitrii TaxID=2650748 RepID=UPI00136F8158|nr:GNAT family N-acetyltransferase [Actinomadura physcomitrii]